MPIFDNELIDNAPNRENKIPDVIKASPNTREISTDMGGFEDYLGNGSTNKSGVSLDDLSDINIANPMSWDSPVQMIPRGELLDNQKYGKYERGLDLENVYGLSQGWMKQLTNGVVKMGATAAGTFIQSFATIPNTISAIRHGKTSELVGNPDSYESIVDNWLKNIENYFPNYYTRHEREHPFLSAIPGFAGSANFWGDKVIKNIGFTVGAIGGALAQDAIIGAATQGIGDVPLIGAQIGRAALWLNKLFTGTKDVEKVLETARALGKAESQILTLKRLQELAAATKVTNGFRYMMNLYGSARTEAGIEARDGYRQVKEELLKQYKLEHLGEEASGDDLNEIDRMAEDAMNIRFGINMAILTVSNAIQFDNLLKSYGSARKGLTGTLTRDVEDLGKIGLVKGSIDTFERKVPVGLGANTWDFIKPKLPVMFSEGVYEEGGQYAAERGTYDYYTRKYKNFSNPDNKENWDTLHEIVKSTNYGLMEQFGTDEGKENMLIGALSALITNGLMGRVDKIKGQGKEARLQYAINTLNQYGLTGILSNKYTDTLNTVGIVREIQDAVKTGNVFKYKNLKNDMFFSLVNSRIRIGMHDVTLEQLNMLKDLNKEDFEKTFGVAFDESGRKSVNTYVDALIKKANDIKSTVDALDNTFRNPFKNIVNPTTDEEIQEASKYNTFNEWKTDLAYYSSVATDVDERLQSMQSDLTQINSLLTNNLLATLTDKDSLKELSKTYEEKAKQLNETLATETSAVEKKRIKEQVKTLRTMSEKINLSLNKNAYDIKDFNSIVNFELNNQDASKANVLSLENAAKLIEYGTDINKLSSLKKRAGDTFDALSSKQGFEKYFNQADEIASQEEPKPEVKVPEKETKEATFETGREYELSEIKPAKVFKIADDRFQIEAPDGTITFQPTEDKANEEAKEIDEEFASRAKVKVLATNPDGTIKIEDSTGNVLNVPSDTLKGYTKIITDQERLAKSKEALDKLQSDLEHDSGTIGSNTPENDNKSLEAESFIKDAAIYHASSVSESEDLHDPSQSAPHVQRSREFLNNAKDYKNNKNFGVILVTANNEESLGLKGLTELSYNGNSLTTSKDVDEGFIAQVYVERADGKIYFIDSKGERISEINTPVDINRVVFQTMPTTATHYDGVDTNGKPYHIPRFRKDQEEEWMNMREVWKRKRAEILTGTNWDGKFYNFKISRGIPILDSFEGVPKKNHVGGILVPENKISTHQGLIVVSATGTITHQGENIKFPKGRPVLQYFDTLQFLNNNKLTANEAKTIYRIIKELAEDIIDKSKKGKAIELNKRYIAFLQNILYFRKDSKTINNQIFIDTKNMSISLGGQNHPIADVAKDEEAITNHLMEIYHNTNNTTLMKKFEKPFYELFLDDEGNIQEREWTNYQTYLLSSTNPDGSSRSGESTPLYTNVAPQTDAIYYSYVQKYSTLVDLEMPRQSTKKEEKKAEAPKIGEYVLDGETVNTFKGKAGEVTFTAEVDENNNISINTTVSQELLDKTKLTAKQITDNILAVLTKSWREQNAAKKEEKTDKEDLSDKKPDVEFPDDEYRRIGTQETAKMTEAELELFKQWHKEHVPNIPFEVLSNIIDTYDGEKAWGVFENGVAKFYKGAIKGTEYHEVFEGIWKAFLPLSEKEAILNEFKTRKGSFIDRVTNKKIDFADATDLQAKERIADDFADFRVGKLPARTLGEKILRFFKNIIEFFKSFISHPSLKEQLFKSIEKGRFKEQIITGTHTSPEYRRIWGVSETEAFEYVQDMTARTAQYIFGENKKSLYDLNKITGTEIYNNVKALYQKENKYDHIGEEAFEQLWKRTKENLQTLGIRINDEDRIDINNDDISNKSYAPEAFSTDWKKSSSFAIKFTCATTLQTEPTNQQNATSMSLPKRVFSSIKGYRLNNFNRIFATLMDKLSNTTDVNKAANKLLEVAKYDADFVRFFQRVGGDLSTGTINFSNFKNEDWRLFIEFYQTFTKQRPNALIQYINGSEIYTAPANQYTAAREIENGWFENIKAMSKDKKSVIVRNSVKKVYEVNKHAFPKNSPRSVEDMIEFLGKIGIDFSIESWNKLKPYQQTVFAKAVGSIYTYLQTADNIGSIKGRTLTINEQLSSLSNLLVRVTNPNHENTYFGVEGTMHQSNEENNAPSLFENEFNESATLQELLEKKPELNDVLSTHSVILRKGGQFFDKEGNRIKDMKVSYIQGQNDLNKRKGLSTRKVSFSDGITMEINQNLNGNYYILIPGDSSTEWMLNLGNTISYEDISTGRAWAKIYNIFNAYLKDEISLALDYKNRSQLRSVKNRAKELRFFKDILHSKELNGINSLIDEEASQEAIDEYLAQHSTEINESVKDFINKNVEDTKKLLFDNNQIHNVKEGLYAFPKLDNRFANDTDVSIKKFAMSENDLANTLNFVTVNYIINNVEFHKLLFGDPYQFAIKAGKLEETKRVKSFISPRRTTFDTPEYNTFLNEEYNKAGEIQLEPTDPGYHQHKSYASTITLADVTLATSNYSKVVEADAFSIIMDNAHREVMLKNGQWTIEAEKFHQWQMAYTRNKLAAKGRYKYTNPTLKAHDEKLISKPEPKFAFNIIKPIVSGSKNDKNRIDLVLHKFSQMPLYYKMAEGKNLEKFYLKMLDENMDYAVFESGQKVGTEQTHPLYNGDGSLNNEAFNNLVEVPWKTYGLQLNTIHEDEGHQTRGSQITKLVSVDLFDNGEPIGETEERKDTIRQLYQHNKEMLDKMHQHAYKTILKKLGVEDAGTHFILVDKKSVSETLEYELLRRELSENAKDTIQLDENGEFIIPFEASTSYKQIKDIIYSIIHKTLVAPKVSGGMHIQAPATLWEDASKGRGLIIKTDDGYKKISREEYNNLPEEDKKKVKLSSDTLKFYTKEAPYCEVMIPHWFRDNFDREKFPTDESILTYLNNTEEGRQILQGVAFRIPTQSMSSIEVFKVKAFLPASMGDTVIVPSEITAKTGSDFDIDKLNMYLKSVYVDRNGDVRLVTYKGSEEATREFYNNVYSETIERKIEEAGRYDNFRDTLIDVFTKIENLEGFTIRDLKEALTEDEYRFYYKHLEMIQNIIDQASEAELSVLDYMTGQVKDIQERKAKLGEEFFNYKMRDAYVDSMYKKALENEYYSSMEKLIALPENYDRLISPVDNDILLKVAARLNTIKGKGDESLTSNLVSRNFMAFVRHAFLAAKQWIGIGAVNNTSHSLMQKSKIYLDPKRINALPKSDREILRSGVINLPHNTVTIDGNEYVSLSAAKTVDGKQLISSRLSAYISSFVDAVNNPYIADIISSDLLVSTYMFLERIGVGELTPMFLNQPIITEYVKYLDSIGYKYLYKKANIDYIYNKFPSSVTADIDVNSLESNIDKYYNGKLSDADNAVQQAIFREFLKYSKMAEHSFDLTQASNYDTTKFKNSDSFSRKNTKTKIAREKNIFISVDNVLNDNFIGEEKELLDLAMDSVGAIIKLERDEFTNITGEVIEPFEQKKISQDDFEKVASRVKASFLDYIVQIKTKMNQEIASLMLGENSISRQLTEAKKRHSKLKILNDLQTISSDREDGAQTLKLIANIKDAYDENLYTEMMRELKDVEPELYQSIIKVAILQGSYQSAVSIKNIIPVEDYSRIIKPIIDSLTATPEIRDFANGMFQRNNWKNDIVVPIIEPYFRVTSEVPSEDVFGNDIYQYFSPAFPNIQALGLKSKDRKILLVNPIYNPLEATSDFLKVPRVISPRGSQDQIDIATGLSVPGIRFVQMKKAGDMSLRNIYGYQKVKYPNGESLVTNKGEFVYKLVNLWGDGQLLSEYYSDFRPSAIHNGTARIDNEIPNADIINLYAPPISVKIIEESPTEESKTEEKSESWEEIKDLSPERKEEILTNFANKHKISRAEVIAYINESLSKDREKVIDILKNCY